MAEATLNTGGLDDAAAGYARAMDRTLRTWAFEVERRAKKKSPIDTGFNANTIYTVAPDGKMLSNNQAISERPGANSSRTSTKNPGRKYKPGTFADLAPTSGGYQDLLHSAALSESKASSTITVGVQGGQVQMGPPSPAPDGFATEVRVGSSYGIYLEMGTFRMQAQPFLGPAAAEVTPLVDSLMKRNMQREGLV